MKYEYGVEYETNGKKPDLPDGIVVEWYSWTDDGPEWHLPIEIQHLNKWDGIESFRIVDERYKPVDFGVARLMQDGEDNKVFKAGIPPPSAHAPSDKLAETFTFGNSWYDYDKLEQINMALPP